jgi:hypothetical protein
MNSWRLSSVILPAAVRKSMPCDHSASVSCTSRAKSCRCRTRLSITVFRRGLGVAPCAFSAALVMVHSSMSIIRSLAFAVAQD